MSIYGGLDVIIQHYLSKPNLDAKGLIEAMVACLETNWAISPRRQAGKRPSPKNWRFEAQLAIASHNQSPEKTLEKAIVGCLKDWANQVPTASGLFGQYSDTHRNIDLV